jgi:hypothetical protein
MGKRSGKFSSFDVNISMPSDQVFCKSKECDYGFAFILRIYVFHFLHGKLRHDGHSLN